MNPEKLNENFNVTNEVNSTVIDDYDSNGDSEIEDDCDDPNYDPICENRRTYGKKRTRGEVMDELDSSTSSEIEDVDDPNEKNLNAMTSCENSNNPESVVRTKSDSIDLDSDENPELEKDYSKEDGSNDYTVKILRNPDNGLFTCPVCKNYQMHDGNRVVKHVKHVHKDVRCNVIVVDDIMQGVIPSEDMNITLVEVGKNEEWMLVCPFCPELYKFKSALIGHLYTNHKEKMSDKSLKVIFSDTHKCGMCRKFFNFKPQLKQHIIAEHGKYECEDCHGYYKTKADLRKHVAVIHKEKSYLCPNCGESFSAKHVLKKHFKTTHLKKKAYRGYKVETYIQVDQ